MNDRATMIAEIKKNVPGPWCEEPDRIEWRYKGVPCLIVRNPMGALCGYAGVAPGHPLFEKHYDVPDVNVHGGLTFADTCHEGEVICHTPLAGEPEKVWWFGFDCAHYRDFLPGTQLIFTRVGSPRMQLPEEVYRDVPYVRTEVESLADQLLAAAGNT
jgi:hypothetical protein